MAGEAMTLIDYAATQKENYLLQAFVNAMMDDNSAGGITLLDEMKWKDIDSLSATVVRMIDEGGPAPTGRSIQGVYNSGIATPVTESVSIGNVGQDVVIDQAFLLKPQNYINSMEPKALQTTYLSKRIRRVMNDKLMNATKVTDPTFFNGIRYLCDSNQVVNLGSTDVPNGASLTDGYTNGMDLWRNFTTQKARDFLTGLDYLLHMVPGATHLIMNDQAQRTLRVALRDTPGLLSVTTDTYNRTFESYGPQGKAVKIINPGSKSPVEYLKAAISDTNAVLPNNYTYGTASTATEVYAIRINENDGLIGLQYTPLRVREVTKNDEMPQAPAALIRADWYPGLYRIKKDAIAKLTGLIVV